MCVWPCARLCGWVPGRRDIVYIYARVIREGPTTADVYIDISPFYGMAPATVSGYRSGGRRYA